MWRRTIALTITLAVVALLAVEIDAAVECVPISHPTELNVRSGDNRGIFIAIYGDAIVSVAPPSAIADINANVVSPSNITFESILLEDFKTPPVIALSMVRRLDYDIWANESLRVELPSGLFQGGVACPPFGLQIRPAPGAVDVSNVTRITEATVNSEQRDFEISIEHEEFMNARVAIKEHPLPIGLRVTFALSGAAPSRRLIATVHRNTTLNIQSTVTLTFVFGRHMTRSGLAPIIGQGTVSEDARLVISPVPPSIIEQYDVSISRDGILSEVMWDGGAVLYLQLSGDTWIQNAELWSHPDFEPIFTVQTRPVQPFGFQSFLNRRLRPRVLLTPRRVTLVFPACPGFALSSAATEEVSITRLNALVSEGVAVSASFFIRQARASSVLLQWSGRPFSNAVTEAEVRKSGLQISLSVRYDVFGTGTNLVSVKRMFSGVPRLSLNDLTFSVLNLTRLVLTIPAQPTYDIERSEMLNMTLDRRMLSMQAEVFRSRAGFVIRPLAVVPTCAVEPGTVITEDQIRSRADVNITVTISSGNDDFCYTDGAIAALSRDIRADSGALGFTLLRQNARSLVIGIVQNAAYDLNSNDVISIPLPTELMCSLEMCKPDPPPSDRFTPNTITLAVRVTPGRLFAVFPAITEAQMRTTNLIVDLELVGDSFTIESFTPFFSRLTGRADDRGFKPSIENGCRARRNATNFKHARMECRANSSYDISVDESLTIFIAREFVSSGLLVVVEDVVPLRISVAAGVIFMNVPRNVTTSEEQIIRGGFTIVATLNNDRWNSPSTLSSVVKSRLVVSTPAIADGVVALSDFIFAVSAFHVNDTDSTLTLTFGAAPVYNILEAEVFTFSFSSSAVLSGLEPLDAAVTFTVIPTPGRLAGYRTPQGHAMEAGARQVLLGGLSLDIELENDLWVPTAAFSSRELCPFSSCIIGVSESRRTLQIAFQANRDFRTFVNRTFVLPMQTDYFASRLIPSGNVSILIFVTSGRLQWSGPTVVDEDQIRKGLVTTPLILQVDGDLFSDITSIRRSLTSSVSCSGTNDAYGFCAQAAVMFGGVEASVSIDERRFTLRLQANEEFDIFVREVVTFRFSGTGLQSRKDPNATETHTMIINVVQGQYFLSGYLPTISAHDITGASRRTLRIVLTLYGERWVADKAVAVARLLQGGVVSGASDESNAFATYKSAILPASSATLSSDQRVLSLQFMPVERYELTGERQREVITVTVPQDAVLSSLAPALSSVDNTFVITAGGGIITSSPATVSAAVVRTQGVNVTLTMTNALWDQEVVQLPSLVRDSVTSGSAPQQEPHGFTVLRDTLMSRIDTAALGLNGTFLTFSFSPAADYSLYAPEVWTIRLSGDWTKSKLPPSPTSFELRVSPDFRKMEATVRIAGVFDPNLWIRAVSDALNVPTAFVEVESIETEPNLADLPQYRRIRFRVRADPATGVEYDNRATELFVGMAPELQLRRFNVVAAFYNSSPPAATFWARFRPNPPDEEEEDTPALRTEYLLIFAGGLAIIVAAVWGYMRYRSGGGTAGVKRARADQKSGRRLLVEEDEITEADANLYSGQRKEIVTLNKSSAIFGGVAAHATPATGILIDDDSPDGSPVRVGGTFAFGNSLATSGNTAAATAARDARLAALEVPLMLYSGQRTAAAAAEASRNETAMPRFDPEELEQATRFRDDYGIPVSRTVYPPYGDRSSMFHARSRFDLNNL